MNCPRCQAEMVSLEIQGVALDLCESCGGTWFDDGELAFYTETNEDVPSMRSALDASVITHSACPRCGGTRLVETPFMEESDLRVDICPSCHGVFLDRMELSKVEALSAERDVLTKVGRTARQLREQGFTLM